MNNLSVLWQISICVILVSACGHTSSNELGNCVPNKYSANFDIVPTEDGYVVSSFNAITAAKQSYNLVRTTADDTAAADVRDIKIPVERVLCLSTTYCAFIAALDERNSIKGTSTPQYICDSILLNRYKMLKINDIGFDKQLDFERILELKPDVVFAYSVDNAGVAAFQKLLKVGVPVVFIDDFREEKPLGRTEWIKFFACFYDKYDFAVHYFDSVENNYQSLKSSVGGHHKRPSVLVGLPWQGTWWVPGGKSFFANFINDAGGNYIYQHNNHHDSRPMDTEKVFATAQHADVWLNPNNARNIDDICNIDNRFTNFQPLHKAAIFNNIKRTNANGGADFWESGIIHPDIILHDLIDIFYNKQQNMNLTYYISIN